MAALKAALAQLRDEGDPSLLRLAISMRASFAGQPARLLRLISPYNGHLEDLAGLLTRMELESGDDAKEDARLLLSISDSALSAKVPRFREYLEALVFARDKARGMALLETATGYEDMDAILQEILAGAPATSLTKKTHPLLFVGDPAMEHDIALVEPLAEDILFPGYTVASGRWKKSRKTTFFLALSFAIQSGTLFLGRKTRKSRCLWVQRDMTIRDFVLYSREIRQGLGLGPTAIPFVAEPMDLTKPVDQKCLIEAIKTAEAEVLFIDSARAVARVKENDSDEVAGFTRSFLCGVLRDQLGLSVILIGHPSKHGVAGMRGSGDWEAGADNVLTFKPYILEDQAAVPYVEISGEGRSEAVDLAFRVDYLSDLGGGWVIREVDQDEKTDLKARLRDPARSPEAKILTWLEKNLGDHTAREIERGARLRNGTAPKALLNLMGRGEVESHEGKHSGTTWARSQAHVPRPTLKGGGTGDSDMASPGHIGTGGDT